MTIFDLDVEEMALLRPSIPLPSRASLVAQTLRV